MSFFSQFLCDFTHGPERAGLLEHLFCVLWLGLTIGGMLVILLTVVVWVACHLIGGMALSGCCGGGGRVPGGSGERLADVPGGCCGCSSGGGRARSSGCPPSPCGLRFGSG